MFPAVAQKGRTMAGLPASLSIAIYFVAALWVVAAIAHWLGYSGELVWVTAVIGSAYAAVEWCTAKKNDLPVSKGWPGEGHD